TDAGVDLACRACSAGDYEAESNGTGRRGAKHARRANAQQRPEPDRDPQEEAEGRRPAADARSSAGNLASMKSLISTSLSNLKAVTLHSGPRKEVDDLGGPVAFLPLGGLTSHLVAADVGDIVEAVARTLAGDGSVRITAKELQDMMLRFGPPVAADHVRQFMLKYDSSCTGAMDFEDFLEFMGDYQITLASQRKKARLEYQVSVGVNRRAMRSQSGNEDYEEGWLRSPPFDPLSMRIAEHSGVKDPEILRRRFHIKVT
ncbi:MAG: hypothetical protein BJ554DRAFT_7293, partial [Olpidium bornovanus]